MSTVQEIETAIERLTLDQKFEIHRWLGGQLDPACPPEGYFADAYKVMAEDKERMRLEERKPDITST